MYLAIDVSMMAETFGEKGVKRIGAKATLTLISQGISKAVLHEPFADACVVVFIQECHTVRLHHIVKIGCDDIIEFIAFSVHSDCKSTIVPVLFFLKPNLCAVVVVVFHLLFGVMGRDIAPSPVSA